MILGASALGFIVTFLILGSKIMSLTNAMLPLLAFVIIYLLLISLNMLWVARTVSRLGQPAKAIERGTTARRVRRLLLTVGGLAFGVLAAIWYVHSVSK